MAHPSAIWAGVSQACMTAKLQPDVSRCLCHSDELVRRLVVLRESSDAFDVGEDVGERLRKLIGAVDHIDMIAALFAFEVEVEGRYECGGAVHSLFDHRECVLWCRVEVAGLRWRFQLIDGIIHFLNNHLEDRIGPNWSVTFQSATCYG